jgi:hypothetical protein
MKGCRFGRDEGLDRERGDPAAADPDQRGDLHVSYTRQLGKDVASARDTVLPSCHHP